jgi:DNA repair exonuclease SbcCD ATPase subunit
MLKRIKLTHFRRHADLELEFTRGLQVIRAPNEFGKSTLIEAITYALYGASFLRTSLEEAVTWGQPPRSLKVALTLTLEGKDYDFTRALSGAEVSCQGQILATGQREVSAFSARLLGADGQAAQRLLFANQNGIRGALEEGPKAIAGQIEDLAGFDLFDRIIAAMQEKLLLGAPVAFEARLTQAREGLQAWKAPEKPNKAKVQEALDTYEEMLDGIREKLASAKSSSTGVKRACLEAEQGQKMRESLMDSIARAEAALKNHRLLMEEARKATGDRPRGEEFGAVQAKILQTEEYAEFQEIYREFKRLEYPEIFWEGDAESLQAEIGSAGESLKKTEEEARELRGRLRDAQERLHLAEARIVKDFTCPTCGQEIRNLDEVKAKNAALAEEIERERQEGARLQADILRLEEAAKQGRATLDALHDLHARTAPFDTFLVKYGKDVDVDRNFVPPRISWTGSIPDENPLELAPLKELLAELERRRASADRAEGQLTALTAALPEHERTLENYQSQLAKTPEADLEGLRGAVKDAEEKEARLQALLRQEELNAQSYRMRVEQEEADYERALLRGKELGEAVAQAEKDLATLAFNNALMKKIRAIRPRVADRLWNRLLAAAGAMFSRIRGEDSLLVKDAGGFKCNGQAIESLSGSTLDALGVALRVALTKTFLPHCDFTVLDEPAAACDTDRALRLLGFLASAGFGQILLSTHEDVSENFADTLIALG